MVLLALLACRPAGGVVIPPGSTGETGDVAPPVPPPTGGLFDESKVLVVPHAQGLTFLANDGSVSGEATWSTLVGTCVQCGGEGASADGDGLLVSFTAGAGNLGDVARLDGDGALDFRLAGFGFPHDAVRDPADDTILVVESTSNVIRWIDGDGASPAAVRLLDDAHPDWPGMIPNGADRFDHAGRSWLLVSHRGTGGGSAPGTANGGISLWDITTAGDPTLAWQYPPTGALDTPHGPILREFEGRWWLLYAHTYGALVGGSVGLAVTDDPTVAPRYVADVVPAEPFEFLRGVELTSDGWLYLTDSGALAGSGSPGRVVKAPMPSGLVESGATGAVDEDQVAVDLAGPSVFAQGLERPFEGWLWTPAFSL